MEHTLDEIVNTLYTAQERGAWGPDHLTDGLPPSVIPDGSVRRDNGEMPRRSRPGRCAVFPRTPFIPFEHHGVRRTRQTFEHEFHFPARVPQ